MIRRPREKHFDTIADINITNLVDVVLVLLIIFMISAPLLQSGIEIDLPQTRAAVFDEETTGVVITIDAKGGIYIDDVWTRLDGFEKALRQEMQVKETSSVFLRGDSSIAYGLAIEVIGRLKDIGIENIGLVTAYNEPGKGKRSGR